MLFRPSPSSARLSSLHSRKAFHPICCRLRAALRSASCRRLHRSKAPDSMFLTLEGNTSRLIRAPSKHHYPIVSRPSLSWIDWS